MPTVCFWGMNVLTRVRRYERDKRLCDELVCSLSVDHETLRHV